MRTRLLLFLPAAAAMASAQPPEPASPAPLQQAVEAAVAGFEGSVGVYVRHLKTGESAAIAAEQVFPTASLIKVPILCGLLARVDRGEFGWHDKLTYTQDRLYAGEDLLGSFQDGQKIALNKLANLMIGYSDNTASLWCQELAGTGTAINRWLEDKGFEKTRVNSRTEGREEHRKRFGWGQTTAREMADLVTLIRDRKAVSPAADEVMHRILTRCFWDGEGLSQFPPGVQVASKQGAVNASRSEVALVHAPSGDFVVCVITADQKDQSWAAENAGWVLIRRLCALSWSHFEPGHPYRPVDGLQRYR